MKRLLAGILALTLSALAIAQNQPITQRPVGIRLSSIGSAITTGCTTANAVLYNASTPCSANLTFSATGSVGAGPLFSVGTGSGTSAGLSFGYVGTSGYGAIHPTAVTASVLNYALAAGATQTVLNAGAGTLDLAVNRGSQVTTILQLTVNPGSGPFITAGTTGDNTHRALSISQTWTDGTTGNIGIVGNFDMGATGTATGKLLSLQAGAAGTTEMFHVRYDGYVESAANIKSGNAFISTAGYFIDTKAVAISTAPTIASGGCTSPTVTNANGTAYFTIDVGTSCSGSQPVVFTMPAATTGWLCTARHVTTPASNIPRQSGAISTTSVTITNYAATTGLAAAWTDGDDVTVSCMGG